MKVLVLLFHSINHVKNFSAIIIHMVVNHHLVFSKCMIEIFLLISYNKSFRGSIAAYTQMPSSFGISYLKQEHCSYFHPPTDYLKMHLEETVAFLHAEGHQELKSHNFLNYKGIFTTL